VRGRCRDRFSREIARTNKISLGLQHLPGFDEISKYKLQEHLSTVYGPMVGPGADRDGLHYHISVNVDLATDRPNGDEFLDNISRLKMHCSSAPLRFVFDEVEAGNNPGVLQIPHRRDETLYIVPTKEGTVVVIFQVRFRETNDLTIADVFMKEFQEVGHSLGHAPSVAFLKTAPLELQGIRVEEGPNIGFVSFALSKRHFTAEKRDASIKALCNFRNYLHYHIKCSKAYMHMRMRKRVVTLLQVLNRAKPQTSSFHACHALIRSRWR